MGVRILRAGVIAGLVGGVLFEAFLIAVLVVAYREPLVPTIVSSFQFVAAGAIGKSTAFTSPAFAWLGAVVHFVVSIGWATGYAYLAQTREQLLSQPLVSGVFFGVIVFAMMQVILLAAGLFASPTSIGLLTQLTAHCVFFGIPVAYVVARLMR
ncbi:MAG: hypothetical protein JO359_05090 [Candidatus Eremiobacteraeota bacterium]|nr:hypothetical protein [Candidatus Eremiobacteraeota bacterium]